MLPPATQPTRSILCLSLLVGLLAGRSAAAPTTAPSADLHAARTYNVRDLLIPVPSYELNDPAPARPMSRREHVAQFTAWLRRSLDPTDVDTLLELREQEGKLVLTATPAQHARAERLLQSLSDGRRASLSIRTQQLSLPPIALDQLPASARDAIDLAAAPGASGGVAISVEDLAALQKSATSTATAPHITLFNGQSSYLIDGQSQAYVSGFAVVPDAAGKLTLDPQIDTAHWGITLSIAVQLSADRTHVALRCGYEQRTLLAMLRQAFPNPLDPTAFIQIPKVDSAGVNQTVSTALGGPILLHLPDALDGAARCVIVTVSRGAPVEAPKIVQ